VLTDSDWRRLEPLLKNIDPGRQLAAYNRLVLGQTLVESGVHGPFSKQDVAMIVKAVLRWWERLHEVPQAPKPPRGWVAMQLYVPRQRVDDVRRIVDALCGPPVASSDKSR
jgi:hypothetical protein